MSNLTQTTVDTIKKYLLRQQKEVEQNIQTVKRDDPATAPALAESSEPGTDSWIAENHTSTLALGASLKRTAVNVSKALTKIKHGTYGKCENCGNSIETGRLLAMPTAEFCLSCSSRPAKKA